MLCIMAGADDSGCPAGSATARTRTVSCPTAEIQIREKFPGHARMSKDYLPLYLNEFAFRCNHRNDPDIFRALLSRV